LNEGTIIQELILGDQQTFKELVNRFQLPVKNICLGMVHNPSDAEDLAQEVFVEVFRSVRNFRADSRLSTWIYRITVNKSLNFLRKKKRQKLMQPLGELFTNRKMNEISSPEKLHYENIETQQRMQHVHRALDELPENQRIAFILNKFDELSYKEISEVIHLSASGVESLIHRAKVNLQKKLWSCYKKECL
jgi:RNA polymerase sigma-70 factor, ECF subfamily